MDKYNYCEISIGGIENRNVIKTLYEVSASLNSANKPIITEGYQSVYVFPKEFAEYVNNNQSVAGYEGFHSAVEMKWDFDSNDLQLVKDEVIQFTDHLKNDYKVPEENIEVHFTGCKGFQVMTPMNLFSSNLFECVSFHKYYKTLALKLTEGFKYVDTRIYNQSRLIRLPNTINPKSGLYKIALSHKELKELSIEEIKELAKNPREITGYSHNATPIPILNEMYQTSVSQSMGWIQCVSSSNSVNVVEKKEVIDFKKIEEVAAFLEGKLANYDDFAKIGLALASLNEAGRKYFIQIGINNPKYVHDTPETLNVQYDAFVKIYDLKKSDKITLGTLFYIARQYGYKPKGSNYKFTDVNIANKLIELYGQNIRFNHTNKKWYIWDGRYWALDEKGVIYDYMKSMIAQLYDNIVEKDYKEKMKIIRNIESLENIRKQEDILKMASFHSESRIVEKSFDTTGDFFNCNNGTIILSKDGISFKPHERDDMLTQIVEVEYNPSAKAEYWIKFLNTIFNNDTGMIEFIQRALGYTMTTSTSEDLMFFMYGHGRNGKTTFVETIRMLFGDYYKKSSIDLIISKKSDSGIRNDIARLKGARLVVTSEVPQGKKLDESTLKDLTGGDTVTARFMFQEFFEFKPQFKLWVYGNHKPYIRGNDDGIKRRILLIPFVTQIKEEDIIPKNVLMKKFNEELSGILNWALEGYLNYCKVGLKPVEAIKEESKKYFKEMDIVQRFIDECCEFRSFNSISFAEMYKSFKQYAEDTGEYTMSGVAFSQRMREKGIMDKRHNTGYHWLGISCNKAIGTPTFKALKNEIAVYYKALNNGTYSAMMDEAEKEYEEEKAKAEKEKAEKEKAEKNAKAENSTPKPNEVKDGKGDLKDGSKVTDEDLKKMFGDDFYESPNDSKPKE